MVSIPFKREGTFRPDDRVMQWYDPKQASDEFQFPSNGKAHSDFEVEGTGQLAGSIVSIPFKREGTFRQVINAVKPI